MNVLVVYLMEISLMIWLGRTAKEVKERGELKRREFHAVEKVAVGLVEEGIVGIVLEGISF